MYVLSPDVCEILIEPGKRSPAVLKEERPRIFHEPLLACLLLNLRGKLVA